MFLAHFGVALGLKRKVPTVSLGSLFLAAQFVDLLWPTFLLAGLEQVEIAPGITSVTPLRFVHYPISHSLLAGFGWSVAFAATYWLFRRHRKGAVVCGIAVLSHWLLDLISHRPDLPLLPGGHTLVGLGLWDSLWGTLTVELSIFALGSWLYIRSTRAHDRVGSLGLWALLGFLLFIYAGNLLGPPPSNVTAIAWVGQAQWILVVWGYWIDRHRSTILQS